jgi:hypothetical protein
MQRHGFRNDGFLVPHFFFGGLSNDGSMIEGLPPYLTGDIFLHNATGTSAVTGIVKTFDPSGNCYKIFCNDTLTINSSGGIVCDATSLRGAWASTAGALGFDIGGSLGGSGAGGNSSTNNNGLYGSPSLAVPRLNLGGNGGSGGTYGSFTGGLGGGVGTLGLSKINNIFGPSVYQDASLWANLAGGDTPPLSPETMLNWIGAPSSAYASVPIMGGCGGGGCAYIGGATTGGGCAGGGVIYIAADTLVMNGGFIDASGGNADANTGSGGGGGGCIIIVANSLIWANTDSYISAPGGIGGGRGATNGAAGHILLFTNQLVADFTSGTVTKALYDAAVIRYQLKGRLFGS